MFGILFYFPEGYTSSWLRDSLKGKLKTKFKRDHLNLLLFIKYILISYYMRVTVLCNRAIKVNKILSRSYKSLHEHFQGHFTITWFLEFSLRQFNICLPTTFVCIGDSLTLCGIQNNSHSLLEKSFLHIKVIKFLSENSALQVKHHCILLLFLEPFLHLADSPKYLQVVYLPLKVRYIPGIRSSRCGPTIKGHNRMINQVLHSRRCP